MLKKFLMISALFTISACGYHFQNEQRLPKALQILTLESSDPYSDMSRAMRYQLQLRNVNIVEESKNIAVLRINKTSLNKNVASIFKQGREAEKILMLTVEATVKLPNQPAQSISTKISRTFFDNSRAALAKSTEQEMILKDMYEQAARQIIVKMAAVKNTSIQ